METKNFTTPFEVTWWVSKSEPHPEQTMPVSSLHMRLQVHGKEIEISRILQDTAFEDMDDKEVESFIFVEIFNRLYPRERK